MGVPSALSSSMRARLMHYCNGLETFETMEARQRRSLTAVRNPTKPTNVSGEPLGDMLKARRTTYARALKRPERSLWEKRNSGLDVDAIVLVWPDRRRAVIAGRRRNAPIRIQRMGITRARQWEALVQKPAILALNQAI